jgi:hypothetical protein
MQTEQTGYRKIIDGLAQEWIVLPARFPIKGLNP